MAVRPQEYDRQVDEAPGPPGCIFCGRDEYTVEFSSYFGRHFVACSNVECRACGPLKETEEEAVLAWDSAWEKVEESRNITEQLRDDMRAKQHRIDEEIYRMMQGRGP